MTKQQRAVTGVVRRAGAAGLVVGLVAVGLGIPGEAAAQQDGLDDPPAVLFGIRVSAGGRYDNVRMCVATPPGVRGGPALDVAFFAEFGLTDRASLMVTVPVMRPILFAAAFRMLQFEPEVTLLFRKVTDGSVDVVAGPSLGAVFHYGPDFHSARSGADRGPSFFAAGPRIGAFAGLDIKRPGESFNVALGIAPYVAPLWGVGNDSRSGVVLGGSLDALLRFGVQ